MKYYHFLNFIFIYILFSVTRLAQADINLYKDRLGTVDFGFYLQSAGFVEGNNWFGKAKQNIGVKADVWWEVNIEPHINAEIFLPEESELYGQYSFLYAQTLGHDASGATKGLTNPGSGLTEQAYIGWRSGALFSSINQDLIDISYGQQDYKVGNGFIMYRASSSGGKRGAWWLGGRHAFTNSLIGRLNFDFLKMEGFHLESRPRDGGEDKIFNGVNIEIPLASNSHIGLMYFYVEHAELADIDGLDVYDIRTDFSPFSALPNLKLHAEYVYENNGSIFESHAGNVGISYLWESIPWQPTLSYRYAYFQGDDPDTKKNEAFNPLAFGFSGWGTWWQGEITGEHVLGNSNLISHMTKINLIPTENIELDLIYYHFSFDQPQSIGLTQDHFADEVNLITTWNVTRSAQLIATLAVAIPGEGGQEFSMGGNQTWLQGMLYAAYKF